jgi:hypothetical protein
MTGRRLVAAAVLGLWLSGAMGCARLTCEYRWRTEMAPRLEPLQGATAATRRDADAGRAAFKRDYLEACASGL